MENTRETEAGLTLELAGRALAIRHENLPDEVRLVARDCLVDWLGCVFAGLREPVSEIVAEAVREEGGAEQATLIGRAGKVSVPQAALINGAISHALDYDDVNLVLPGHPGVAILPALLALAEHREANCADFYAAFVAGHDTACRVGALVGPSHYANGFHATATIGSLGAAMACAHLLKLSAFQASHALGVAATQAAGLKSMFGTMAKPLHAGMAAQTGVRAALLASKGFVSRLDALECTQGFAGAHGCDFHPQKALAEPAGGYHLAGNIFKFHAACFGTHSTIEAVAQLRREYGLQPGDVERIHVAASQACTICNIQAPSTALEAKFSLRATAAFAMLDIDTAKLDTWHRVTDDDVQAMLARVQVELIPGTSLSASTVTLTTRDGRSFQRDVDVGTPLTDTAEQSRRVDRKFMAVSAPEIGEARARHVLDQLNALNRGGGLRDLLRLCRA